MALTSLRATLTRRIAYAGPTFMIYVSNPKYYNNFILLLWTYCLEIAGNLGSHGLLTLFVK
jgi:hypothetical protein